MRASDADRDRAADSLRDHHAAGRITDEELEDRLAVVLAARSLDELGEPFADLAPLAPPPPEPIVVRGFGVREFRQRHLLSGDRAAAWRQLMTDVVPSMSAYGYTVVDRHEPDYIVLEIDESPHSSWLYHGLPESWFGGGRSRVVCALSEPTPGHTELLVSGAARRPVRRAFAGISA